MKKAKFGNLKSEIRVLGIDDGSFEPDAGENTCLVGVVTRGGQWIDGVLADEVEVDGMDSTSTLVDMIERSRHKEQVRVILTSGITFGGFNVLDVRKVSETTDLPVIVVSREEPDMDSVKEALKNIPDWEDRWSILNSAGEITPVEVKNPVGGEGTVYIQVVGMRREDAEEIVSMTSTRSLIPEPLRLAHLIATGISRGESVGRV